MGSVEEIQSLDELLKKINAPNVKNAYHYTSLESLYLILKNKKLRFSSFEKMNDEFERRLFGSCRDFFFCLSKSSLAKENFGMWSMYGRLRYKEKEDCNGVDKLNREKLLAKARKIGVKIYFPKTVLEDLCKKNNLKIQSVAYTNLREESKDGSLKRFTIGSQTVKKELPLKREKFIGFLKDNAWMYENELRLRASGNDDIMIDEKDIDLTTENIKNLIIYPSPYYEVNECRDILKHLGYEDDVKIQENIYRNTFAGGNQ